MWSQDIMINGVVDRSGHPSLEFKVRHSMMFGNRVGRVADRQGRQVELVWAPSLHLK